MKKIILKARLQKIYFRLIMYPCLSLHCVGYNLLTVLRWNMVLDLQCVICILKNILAEKKTIDP